MMTSLPFWSMLQQSKMIQKWVPNAVEKTALIAGAVFIGAIVAVAILYQSILFLKWSMERAPNARVQFSLEPL